VVAEGLYKFADGIIAGLLVGGKAYEAPAVLLRAAKGLIAGTISWQAFWDVVASVVSATELPSLLLAAGVGLKIDQIFEAYKCVFTNQ
jgi:hypothetical protein